jgi:hypothetical protein
MRFSQIILEKYLDGLMLAHTKGREGNLPVGTQIQSLRMPGALDGASETPTVGHHLSRFVAHSGCFGRL